MSDPLKKFDTSQSVRRHTDHLREILLGKAVAVDDGTTGGMPPQYDVPSHRPSPHHEIHPENGLLIPARRIGPNPLLEVGEHLHRPDGQVAQLVAQAGQLMQMNRIFHDLLPAALHEHAALARLDPESWIVQTDSSAWATRLRYILPGLREPLGKKLGIAVPPPHIRIAPPAVPPPPPPPPRRMSMTDATAQILEGAARDLALSDRRLGEAVMRLVEHARQRNAAQ